MPNMLDVIRDLKALQAKEAAGQATDADRARIAELKEYMTGKKKPDPAPSGPPVRPPAARPAAAPAPVRPAASPPARAAAPVVAPAAAPAAARRPKPAAGEPDAGAFALSLDADLAAALGGAATEEEDHSAAAATTHVVAETDEDPFALDLAAAGIEADGGEDDSDAAKTTFEVEEEPSARGSGANPFALEVPEGLDELDLVEDDAGGVTHELGEEVLDGRADDDPYKVTLADDLAKSLEKADGKGSGAPSPQARMRGTPIVPDAHYEKIAATDASVIVQLRDGRIAKGLAGAFSPQAPSFTLNPLVPGKPPVSIKLEECLTVRFVRSYNGGGTASAPFPATPAPGAVAQGQKLQVQLLDGEKLVGTALAHKDGESFILVPVPGGNVRRLWVSAKAVRSKTKL